MSLYSDLNEVLTPYATKIKGLTAANEELKADLEELSGATSVDVSVDGTSLVINTNVTNGNEVSY